MKARKNVNYLCGTCQLEWFTKEGADCCCVEDTIEKITWICSSCDSEFETEHEANECCANQKLIAEGIKA